jgi:hypothetical protein
MLGDPGLLEAERFGVAHELRLRLEAARIILLRILIGAEDAEPHGEALGETRRARDARIVARSYIRRLHIDSEDRGRRTSAASAKLAAPYF